MLAGNRLRSLPESMRDCHRLELLRIAANQLNELPQWLLTLPSLTWLAYAGNPLETEADAAALEAMITHPEHFKKLMPVIEEQIDHFLRVKLKQSMPVVGMFVGDKTIGQLKTVFVTELETIFPTIMKNYAASLAGEFDAKRLITGKLAGIPPETLVKEVRGALKKELSMLLWLGVITGFCSGAAAVCLVLFLK
jgi:uncharacterized membrane protein YheB (UPF0754 family)